MKKTLYSGLLVVVLLFTVLISNVFAHHKPDHPIPPGWKKKLPPGCVPEPISLVIFLTSGATCLGMRLWKGRRKQD